MMIFISKRTRLNTIELTIELLLKTQLTKDLIMALDINKIRARIAASKQKSTKSKAKDIIWKPTQPTQVVRIVPLQSQPDDPFIRLKFHYDFAGKNYLSPATFGKPDPIVELSDRLKKNGDTWKQGRQLEPKLRTFVPVIVRGEEEKGVRFWGFGSKINDQLEALMVDPEYGDITSLTEGIDLTITYKSKEEVKKDFPEIAFQPKRKQTPVIDPTNPKAKEIMELITTKQPNILDVYEVATYETLAAALEEYLKKAADGESTQTEEDSNVVLPTEEQIAAATTPVPVATVKAEATPAPAASVPSPSAQKAAAAAPSSADLTKAFDNLFNT